MRQWCERIALSKPELLQAINSEAFVFSFAAGRLLRIGRIVRLLHINALSTRRARFVLWQLAR